MITELIIGFETYLLTEKCVSDNTLVAYKRDLEQFTSFCEKEALELQSLEANNLKQFLHYLHGLKLSPRSIVRKISTIKAFFAYLHERHGLKNLAEKLHFPRVEKTLPRYLSELEIKELFNVVDKDFSQQGIRNRVMLYLLYVTGMRITELTTLKITDINFETSFVSVHGKGGKQRLIPVPGKVISIVQTYVESFHKNSMIGQHKKLPRTNYLFPIMYGGKFKAISRQAFWGILKGIWAKTGKSRTISPHQLRHSLATHLLKKGADLRSLQILLGHENLSTVQIYTHVETSYLRTIYDKKHPRS